MFALADLKPKEPHRVMDLVRAAGVDVSDWASFKGGAAKAAANPKYCYEWSFVEPNKVVVLSLWHEAMQERDGAIFQSINYRESARKHKEGSRKAVWEKRALKMDAAIQTAMKDRLPIRVVVCEGKMRDRDDPDADASRVERRLLDPEPWAVTAYDWKTGECILTRGVAADPFVDQFSLADEQGTPPERRAVSGLAFVRDPAVRRRARIRASGKCEWCGQHGFTMADGRIFLETHHLTPLAEGGSDTDDNVAVLCPNHHREAHHGANRQAMKETLLARLRRPEAYGLSARDA